MTRMVGQNSQAPACKSARTDLGWAQNFRNFSTPRSFFFGVPKERSWLINKCEKVISFVPYRQVRSASPCLNITRERRCFLSRHLIRLSQLLATVVERVLFWCAASECDRHSLPKLLFAIISFCFLEHSLPKLPFAIISFCFLEHSLPKLPFAIISFCLLARGTCRIVSQWFPGTCWTVSCSVAGPTLGP
jgi:hypothetical protein